MLGFLKKEERKSGQIFNTVVDGLKHVYTAKLLPLEQHYRFHDFHSPPLGESDFYAKPMVLLVGQYSTGKTTFIKYLLESNFPGMRIGPEPTTDGFLAIMHGEQDAIIPGNALIVDVKRQFTTLSSFGNSFLNKFGCSTMKNKVLESITLIDTPGILSGEKQRVQRGYDFVGVLEWFSHRVDRIILLFDAHKLDISDEFKRSIEALKANDDKIRIVLNKSDRVNQQQLMRVYGALMWSLGKVIQKPEVARVFIGSFWNQPLEFEDNRRLFELEQEDLFNDLKELPHNAALRKLNDLIKRARLAKVHAYIIASLKEQMPKLMYKESTQKALIKDLATTFKNVQRKHNISPGDFPDLCKMQDQLQDHDFSKFHSLNPKMIDRVNEMLSGDIAQLMEMINQDQLNDTDREKNNVKGGVFEQASDTPFGFGYGEGVDEGVGEARWIVEDDMVNHRTVFNKLNPVDGRVSGANAKRHFMESKLPNSVLGHIWRLADSSRNGKLDEEEFGLACHLINIKLQGNDLPDVLPEHLIPPGKRGFNPA